MRDEFTRHQDHVLAMVRHAEQMLAHPSARPNLDQLTAFRTQVLAALDAYRAFAAARLDPLIATGQQPDGEVAATIVARVEEIAALYRSHSERWGMAAVGASPEAYRADGLALAERLRLHLMVERYELAALARAGETSGEMTVVADAPIRSHAA
jgi:hypothetical protein